ncbi:MAG TPA: hypothetical protein VFH45_11420, partial [Acidimicrobiales bacterium]|nr:hypothetical protein [Acidimicrobiales bacterium]
GWPFVIDFTVTYALDGESGLTVTMEAANLGAGPCPFGAGAHPYVMVGSAGIDDLELTHPASTVYDTDDRSLPTGRRPVDAAVDFRGGRRIGDTRLDTAFTDLERDASGTARVLLRRPGGPGSVEVWMDSAFTHLMLFTGDALPDPERRRVSLAVEPMTCAPNALQTGDGLLVLEPGASWRGSWGIVPR